MNRTFSVLLLAACLTGCSAPHPDQATTDSPGSAATNALAGTPLATYGHDLERAKNVQAIVDRQARQQAAQIEAQSGSSSR